MPSLVQSSRAPAQRSALELLAQTIQTLRLPEKTLIVGITGGDASGKTRLTETLASLVSTERVVTIIHVDDFHNPKSIRYNGADPVENYLTRSINFDRLVNDVLHPLRTNGELNFTADLLDLSTDTFTNRVHYEIHRNDVVLVEGVFLARPDVRRHLDLLIVLNPGETAARERGLARDRAHLGDDAETRYDTKYVPAQRQFEAEYRSVEIADILIDTTDVTRPRIAVSHPLQYRRTSFRHTIFDLNGTLVDTKSMIADSRGAHIDRLAQLSGVPREQLLQECRVYLARDTMNPDIADNLPSIQRWAGSDDNRLDAWRKEKTRFKADILTPRLALPGVMRAMTLLRRAGVVVSIWSGSRTPYVKQLLKIHGLEPLVDFAFCPPARPGIVTSLDGLILDSARIVEIPEQHQKPSSDALRSIVEKIGISEEETVLVGNSLIDDALSCDGTAIRFIHTRWGSTSPELLRRLTDLNGVESQKHSAKQSMFGAKALSVIPWRVLQGSLLEIFVLEDAAKSQ